MAVYFTNKGYIVALVTATAENFEQIFNDSDILIIDFWAPWCGPCKSFAPIFEKVAQNHPEITFAKVNTEEEPALANEFQIRSIPTVMIAKEKIFIFQQPGMLPEDALEDIIRQVKELDMDKVREEIAKEQNQAQ